MTLRVGSLFTGLGGLDLGLPGEPAWMCEYDKHARRVLEHRFPGVPVYPDVRELDGAVPPIDMLIGGYPCQPFSFAGKRGGENDPRHLWPEFARLVRLLRPRYVFAENVSAHLALGFDRVLCDLAETGFDAEWVVVRASDVGAPHRRERLFILAWDTERAPEDALAEASGSRNPTGEPSCSSADADGARSQGREHTAGLATRQNCAVSDTKINGLARSGGSWTRWTGSANGNHVAPDAEVHEHRQPAIAGQIRTEPWDGIAWGDYEPAIRRWEPIIGRSAPRPTDDRLRLMPAFSEWMMGLPGGWVTGTDTSRTQQLRMIGNAVVPQQAALAWSILTEGMS